MCVAHTLIPTACQKKMRTMLRKCLGIKKSDCHSCAPDDESEPTSIEHSDAFDINKAQVTRSLSK